MPVKPSKRANFVPAKEKAKSEVVDKITRIARKEQLDYDEFAYVCQQARKKLDLFRPRRRR